MAMIASDTTDRVAAIIGDTLNGRFQPHLSPMELISIS